MEKEIIEAIINNPEYKQICNKYTVDEDASNELYQEFILTMYDYKKQDNLKEIFDRNELTWFCCGIIRNMATSSSSPFFKKVRKFSILSETLDIHSNISDEPYEEQPNDLIDDIDINTLLLKLRTDIKKIDKWFMEKEVTDPFHFYHRVLFEMYYYDNMTYRQISKDTGIQHVSIFNSVNKSVDNLVCELDLVDFPL